ncbi:YegS/Rv2252/BmrU family lipid kinase [Anseongella ginsenosidimutans]|uniref:YegS/Rv2252/BmrU family lipid kinase n=2 Tax=Anseongella ginsenosidimutans TaxID=496056 RepID=A0A4R3KWU8_9SPHI|nr:diacylglycerol kinase family lipid kinase [Anseongella ginsenosidimutans]TCS89216.1 YegS/Rv2252/BmrU family lipid kinase [Anseongella ginsenosidimutans]
MVLQFIVNPGSGGNEADVTSAIKDHFRGSPHEIHIYELKKDSPPGEIKEDIKAAISRSGASRVIAAGGDGTVKLVAECLLKSKEALGILPTGSANGMAKELGIPLEIPAALEIAVSGVPCWVHAVSVNGELCIHLADLGFNAFLVKKFDSLTHRGMWGYARAAWHALWFHRKMKVELDMSREKVVSEAAMVVIANGTMYGTGVKINPVGKLSDDLFEVVLVKKYSLLEVLKMRFTHTGFNPKKVEFFQTSRLHVRSRHRVHLQVDGEYLGKVKALEARILPSAIRLILPPGQEV